MSENRELALCAVVILVAFLVLRYYGSGPSRSGLHAETQNAPNHASTLSQAPNIDSNPTEGFYYDIDFYIEDFKMSADGSQILRASGLYKGRHVEIGVLLSPKWNTDKANEDLPITTHSGQLTYHSLGKASDAFVEMLDELYGTGLKPKAMAKETVFAAISLAGDPKMLAGGIAKIKLFYEPEPGNEETYVELFTNIDLPHRRLSINEKDPDYRKPLVRVLSRHQ